ncbi:caspase-like [Toxorhynchites rutilus septentrionalis]|uniref:caspase-like n=1 Tax=Toxorhynchites rutilus septentrionalis TaxID=329112 RepID=UPI0024786BAA|nr:caspase-like [Toxorhynchites rutilus septentrionalis]
MKKIMFSRKEINSSQNRPTLPPAYTIDRYSSYYPMNHKNRGKAIIFTHAVFAVPNVKLAVREGGEVDCKMLTESLERLGFDVDLYRDKRLKEILHITEKISSMDHTNSDCLLVAILTHGDEGEIIYAHDCPYQISSVWTQFTGDRCPSLISKPKIFIIQACRGNELDSGVKIEKDGVARYSIPTHADFLFAFATIPGFMSFRNTKNGSWFVRELCNELNENGQRYDLLTLLTFVVQKVAYDYESVAPNTPEYHLKKQTPCIVSMLTRLLLFNYV